MCYFMNSNYSKTHKVNYIIISITHYIIII